MGKAFARFEVLKWIHLKEFATFLQGGNYLCRQEVAYVVFETFKKWGLLFKKEFALFKVNGCT